jgi:hypothetical protein
MSAQWLSLLADLAPKVLWGLLILLVLRIFRNAISDLIQRLERVKYPGGEVTFRDRPTGVVQREFLALVGNVGVDALPKTTKEQSVQPPESIPPAPTPVKTLTEKP